MLSRRLMALLLLTLALMAVGATYMLLPRRSGLEQPAVETEEKEAETEEVEESGGMREAETGGAEESEGMEEAEEIGEKTSEARRGYPAVIKGLWEPMLNPESLHQWAGELHSLGVNTLHVIVNLDESYQECIPTPAGAKRGDEAIEAYEMLIDAVKGENFSVVVILEYAVVTDPSKPPSKRVEDVDAFLSALMELAPKWAEIAERHQVEFFSPINELDQILMESGLEPEEILRREEEFFSAVIPAVRERFSGLIYCKLGSLHWSYGFPAGEGCDLIGVILTIERPDMTPEEFREAMRRQLSEAQEIAEELNVSWIVGECFIPSKAVEMHGYAPGEYYRIVEEELRAVDHKPSGFTFMGWENPIAPVKGTDAEEVVRQILSELESYAAPLSP